MDRTHLDHLPSRTYLAVVGCVAGVVFVVAGIQLLSSKHTFDATLWGTVVALALVSLLALAVAWEERRAHIHALLRQAIEIDPGGHTRQMHIAAMAELTRLGAHREIEVLRHHAASDAESG